MKMESYKPKEKAAKYKNPDIRQFIYDKFIENSDAVNKSKKPSTSPGGATHKRVLKRPRQTICAEIAAELTLRKVINYMSRIYLSFETGLVSVESVPTIKRISKSDDFKDFKDAVIYPNGTMKKRGVYTS